MELERLIKSNVIFGKESNGGFHSTKCPICRDYQNRLGLKFEHGTIGANCFNCGFKARYTESEGKVSQKFRKLLVAFNIDEEEIEKTLASNFINKKKTGVGEEDVTLKVLKKLNLFTAEVELPSGAVLLKDAPRNDCTKKLTSYIEKRGLNIDSHPWYYIPDEYPLDEYKRNLYNRIIIPFYRAGKIIYWQARSINPTEKRRYLNCEVPKAAIVFGYDSLYSWSNKPLFITEGVFDAISIGGVCLLGSTLSQEAISILKKTKRRVIFVLDKDKNGKNLGMQVVENGWEITFPPNGSADVNDSIIKNGKLFTVYHLLTNTVQGFVAKTKINMLCKS